MSLTFIFFKLIKNSQPKAIENAQLKINWLFAEAVAKLYDTLKPNLIFKVASTDHPHINWLLTLISCCAEAILKHIWSHIALKFVVATMCICELNVMRTLCLIRSRVFSIFFMFLSECLCFKKYVLSWLVIPIYARKSSCCLNATDIRITLKRWVTGKLSLTFCEASG